MSVPPPPYQEQPAKKKNWVLLGCGGCLGLILLLAIAGGILYYSVASTLKNTEPYRIALTGAQNNAQVQEALGTPITAAWLPAGQISNVNGRETAELIFAIKGSKSAGAVKYTALREGGAWQTRDHNVTLPDGKVIEIGP